MLRLSDSERRDLMNPVLYGGGAAVYDEWCCEDDYFAVAATVDAPWYPWEAKRSAVVQGRDIDARWGAPTEDSFSCQQMIADEMFQILVRVHLNKVRLGWGVMRDAKTDRDLGTLCPFFHLSVATYLVRAGAASLRWQAGRLQVVWKALLRR